MDTLKTAAEVADLKRIIKDRMPETYKAIVQKSSDTELGKGAWALVTRGLRGEPNCFYAIERGFVVGAPFSLPGITAELARVIVNFGCTHMIMWAPHTGADHGQA